MFNGAQAPVADITKTLTKALVSFLNGNRTEKLDKLRYKKYCDKLTSRKAQVKPQNHFRGAGALWHEGVPSGETV